jgi:hypothetical protein
MRWTKGYIDEEYLFVATTEAVEERRNVWHLLRAQEHVAVAFVLDDGVPHEEAWCNDATRLVPRWRVNPLTIGTWLEQGEIDWRHTCLTPEDFYAA